MEVLILQRDKMVLPGKQNNLLYETKSGAQLLISVCIVSLIHIPVLTLLFYTLRRQSYNFRFYILLLKSKKKLILRLQIQNNL